jgi:hypothetical protein
MLLGDVKNYIIKILFCNIMPRAAAPAAPPAAPAAAPQLGFTVPVSQVPAPQTGFTTPSAPQTSFTTEGTSLDKVIPQNKKSGFKVKWPFISIMVIVVGVIVLIAILTNNDDDDSSGSSPEPESEPESESEPTTTATTDTTSATTTATTDTTSATTTATTDTISDGDTSDSPSTDPESVPVCSPSCAAPTQTCINATCYDKCNSAKCSDDEICVIPSQGSLDEYTIASPSIGPSNISGYVCIASPSDGDPDDNTEGYINYHNKRWIEGRPDMNENDKNVLLPGDNSLFK